MNSDQLKQVLTKIHVGDKRDVDLVVLAYWDELIGGLDVRDALEGVSMHRRESADYLMPAHVIANAKRAKLLRERDERINAPRAITGNVITLDIVQHNKETAEFIEHYRSLKAGMQ